MIDKLKEAIHLSEPQRISPLLDGFIMGEPMSDHDGICCCPAIKENTDQKYIVKIISVPASQVQMDALLLAGAYKDPADAMDYFKELGEGVMQEAQLLKKLSRLGGFLPYEGWQMEPITRRRLGYQVYLVGSYRRSLDRHVRRSPVTHLEAMNLGLDLCAALSVCRQAGALYVDLKPTNIFLSEKKEYSIGDLGFIALDALNYTVIPDKYRSVYTPPELFDPMAPLNLTVDTYAVGMILYQLYNDGQLPFQGKAPEEGLPSPVNADYELAEIIMKAIHPDPEQRWTDPKQMGQALVSYMQRNSVNDVPITPYTPLEPDTQPPTPTAPEAAAPTPADASGTGEASGPSGDAQAAPQADAPQAEDPAAGEAIPDEPAEDDTTPGEADADMLLPHEMSDELSRIMAKADDLITHETPEGVVLPQIPDPPDPFAFAKEDSDEIDDSGIPVDPVMDDPPEETGKKRKKSKKFVTPRDTRRWKRLRSLLISLAVLAAIGFGCFWYYQNVYLLPIRAISIDGDKYQLLVSVDSDVSDELLSVICTDSADNAITQEVTNGRAIFSGLRPNTTYTIRLETKGFHALVGQTSDIFTTDTTTSILSFTSVMGTEDGSVILNFTPDGDVPEEWTLHYSTEGEEVQSMTFTGNSVTVTGLSVGKIYTFVLDAGESLSLSGATTLEYLASRLVLAEDLAISSTDGTDLTVRWKAPGDTVVESWDVRCYSDSGYSETLRVNETEASFSGIDPSASYTVEVTAAGMTQPARISITANPINISLFVATNAQDTTQEALPVSWEYTGNAPSGGWLLMYSIDGSATANVVKCDDAAAEISPWIPGAKYQFTIQAADGTSVFNSVHTLICPEAEPFEENALSAENITAQLLKTPDKQNWRYEDVESDAFTDKFSVGDDLSIVLHAATKFYLYSTETRILYVIRDTHGNVLPNLVSQQSRYWKDIWYSGDSHYGELNVPKAPENAGSYVLNVYFNGKAVAELPFSIVE